MIKFEREKTESEIQHRLAGLLNRSRSIRSFLNRNVVEQYRNVQKKRWMTENASEGSKWKELSPGYLLRKRQDFKKSSHGGDQILYASGDLYKSVIGPGKGFRKITTERKLIIGLDPSVIPYASIHDSGGVIRTKSAKITIPSRPFSVYSKSTIREFYDMIYQYIIHNKLKPGTHA